eukprot:1152010-Pelagomonas_calceolata.AAC.2
MKHDAAGLVARILNILLFPGCPWALMCNSSQSVNPVAPGPPRQKQDRLLTLHHSVQSDLEASRAAADVNLRRLQGELAAAQDQAREQAQQVRGHSIPAGEGPRHKAREQMWQVQGGAVTF